MCIQRGVLSQGNKEKCYLKGTVTVQATRLRQFNGHPLRRGKEQKPKHKEPGLCECLSGGKVARRATRTLFEAKKAECTGPPVRQRASCKRVTCFFFFDYLSGKNRKGPVCKEKKPPVFTNLRLRINNVGEKGGLVSIYTHRWIVHLS